MTNSSSSSSIQYPRITRLRAERAMRSAPFQRSLYEAMIRQGVLLQSIAGREGLQNGYTSRAIGELAAESELLWLMKVGLLRREVDGQGLTDSFRITPLGRQVVLRWQNNPRTAATFGDRLYNALCRWFRLSI
ncbi:MAG: hypothetical protein HC860_01620 [Alkalinema sp. RU_4_3]|nr:hypothetical protein [Alkalinema sp. RU_4_3]